MGVEYEHYLIPEDNTYKPRPEDLSRLVDALLAGGFVAVGRTTAFREMTADSGPDGCDTEAVCCHVRLANGRYLSAPCPCSERDIASLGDEFQLVWSVDSLIESGLTYPLSSVPESEDAYYDLELHVATDFVYHVSELIKPFDEVACPSGQDLSYSEWEDTSEAGLVESGDSSGRLIDTIDDGPRRRPLFVDARIYRLCPACGRPFRPQELVARVKDARSSAVRERAGGATYRFAVVIDCGKCFSREFWPIRASEEFLETVTRVLGQEFYEIGDIY